MDNLLNNETIKSAAEKWGKESQVDMAVEEMSELIKALLKERRNDGGLLYLKKVKKILTKKRIDLAWQMKKKLIKWRMSFYLIVI